VGEGGGGAFLKHMAWLGFSRNRTVLFITGRSFSCMSPRRKLDYVNGKDEPTLYAVHTREKQAL